ncbi:MAG: DUF4403 family protein [Saprospiraceae bacterium]|nr:DUF4403 family protein [Saprospiraceae bacterium]
MASKVDYFVPPDMYSYLNINYRIEKKSLTDTFNFVMDNLMADDLVFPDYDVSMKLKRNGNVLIEFQGKSVLVTLPMDVEVIKKTFIKDLKATGTLEMSFITTMDISKDWSLTTKTMLTDHKWTKRPSIGLGVINLPIETIANLVIRKTRVDLENNIDSSIHEQYNMREIIGEVAKYTLLPYQLDSVFGGWMQMTADSAYLSPAVNTKYYVEGKISMKTKMNITSMKPKEEAFKPSLPYFSWNDNIRDSSTVRLLMELEYDHLTSVARKNFKGKTFSEGDKKIEIIDVVVHKHDGKLQITTNVKGSFNGTLSIMGIPSFDKYRSQLFARDINVSVKSGNVLHSAAGWLLRGKIKSELDKMLQFSLNDNMANLQSQIDEQVMNMNKKYKMKLRVNVGSINIDNFALRPDRANAYLSMKLYFDTTLDNLYLFQD